MPFGGKWEGKGPVLGLLVSASPKSPLNHSRIWTAPHQLAWGCNDANAIFQHRGIFHMLHQCDGGPAGMPWGGGWEGRNPYSSHRSHA